MRIVILIIILFVGAGFIFRNDITGLVKGKSTEKTEKVKKEKEEQPASPGVNIAQQWDLPAALKEVSGIAYIDAERFACVQDEEGTVFIYNRSSGQVEKELPFAGAGDYEGIALKGDHVYVLRADGQLYEMDMMKGQSSVKTYTTGLTAEHNVEGLTYDQKHDRLLLAIKDEEPAGKDYKGIYAFDLATKQFDATPVARIDLKHELFQQQQGGKKSKAVAPSEIAIHPVSGEFYITDGPRSRLLIMEPTGNIKKLVNLGPQFEQPEGISFGPDGELFISNEGKKNAGNILQVSLQ